MHRYRQYTSKFHLLFLDYILPIKIFCLSDCQKSDTPFPKIEETFLFQIFSIFNARESPHGRLNHPQRHPQESPLPHMIILSICSPISLIKSTTNAFPIVKYLFEFVIPSNSVHPSGKVLILSVSIGERTLNRLLPGSLTT